MILTAKEIEALTGKSRTGWQRRELEHLGIPYRERSDGSLLVLWEDVRATQDVRPREPRLRLDA
jgi:hypothetical protein